ncbi:MAG: methyltransferase domain-containing protein [Alphaproteobacteria bacterium]
MDMFSLDTEKEVLQRYSAASQAREEALCCPVAYDPHYLKVIPQEIIDRDYGCGDPSQFVRSGESVLDLGSGGGKICYIIAQIVGRDGRVTGVDFNPPMLELANKYHSQIVKSVGFDNIEFKRGKIQDLRTDITAVETWLAAHPVPPLVDVPLEEAGLFDYMRSVSRHPKETKGEDYTATTEAAAGICGPEGCC